MTSHAPSPAPPRGQPGRGGGPLRGRPSGNAGLAGLRVTGRTPLSADQDERFDDSSRSGAAFPGGPR